MYSKQLKLVGIKNKKGFDANAFTKEEAEAQFKPYDGRTQRGYPYTGYEYDGVKYHDYTYLGVFDDNDMPTCDDDLRNRKD